MTVPADPELVRTARRESRVRGMLLGLALGDAALRPVPGDDAPLLGTATTQLACATAEGLLRAIVRQNHRGICHEPTMLWHALLRWATLQGIPGASGKELALDGWLADVPALRRRRGDAPATVAALRAGSRSPEPAANDSRGHHALTRLVPLAVGAEDEHGRGPEVARASAAATHGAAGVGDVVAAGTALLGLALAADDVAGWTAAAPGRLVPDRAPAPTAGAVGAAPTAADLLPGLAGALRGEPVFDASPLSARAALLGAAATAVRFPGPGEVARAIAAATTGPGAEGVAPMTGALLGAVHGVESLPGDVWRLELGHVADTLARDLVVAMWAPRDGGEWEEAADPHWTARYPGS